MTRKDMMKFISSAYESDNIVDFAQLLTDYPECRTYSDGSSGNRWLSDAALDGKLEILKVLISSGADVNEPSNPGDSVPAPEGAIVYACDGGHLEVVRYLLDRGAKINHVVNGRVRCQALVGAVIEGHVDVAKLLVDRGAEVNAIWGQMTPLDRAVMHRQTAAADYLRSVGGKTAMEVDPEAASPPKKKGRGKR